MPSRRIGMLKCSCLYTLFLASMTLHLQVLGLLPSTGLDFKKMLMQGYPMLIQRVEGCSSLSTPSVSIPWLVYSKYSTFFPSALIRICVLTQDSPCLSACRGCSGHSTPSFSCSRLAPSKFSVSFPRPWSQYIDERLPMLISVSECSSANTLFLISMTCTSKS